MTPFDIDRHAADSLTHQRASAAGPLTAAMQTENLAISETGQVTLPKDAYEPMLQIAPTVDLADQTVEVRMIRLTPDGDEELGTVRFAPFSEKLGFVPAYVPATGPSARLAAAEVVQLRLRVDGQVRSVAQLPEWITVRYAEGRFARLLAVAQTETIRTRRLARELAARRTTALANGFLLDRIGRELAVPRFEDRLEAKAGEILLQPEPESDADYRRRLDIFRPFRIPTRSSVLAALNSPDSPLIRAGAPPLFDVKETDNPFMVGYKIVGVGRTADEGRAMRARYITYLRETILIDPAGNAPAYRALSQRQRKDEDDMRRRLRNFLQFTDSTKRNMAPWLASAFDRMARLLDHLGVAAELRVVRALDPEGDSRFELGLAAEVRRFVPTKIAQIRDRITNGASTKDTELQGILDALRDDPKVEDDGAWLFRACGFRTFLPTAADRYVVSHVSLGALRIEGPDGIDRVTARKRARFGASIIQGNSGLDAALANALSGGTSGWPPGVVDWTVAPRGQQGALIDGAETPPLPRSEEFKAMGLTPPPDITHFVRSLRNFPNHSWRLLLAHDALAQTLRADSDAAAERLGMIADILGANGAAGLALLKLAGGELAMVVSSIGLPQIGTNIGPRRSSDFFWGATAISGKPPQLRGQGTQTLFGASSPGVYAVSTMAYSRIGETDPFEWRVTLPRDARLTLAQYEILMNLLTRMFPVGVEINTWDIRRHNVALEPGADATPLSPTLARAYRPFRRARFHGSGDPTRQIDNR